MLLPTVRGSIGWSGLGCGHAHRAGHPTKNGHDFPVHPRPRSRVGIDLAERYRHGVNCYLSTYADINDESAGPRLLFCILLTRRTPVMFTPKGKFGWYELMTSDTKA